MRKINRAYNATVSVRRYLKQGRMDLDTLRHYLVKLYKDHRGIQFLRDVLEVYEKVAPSTQTAWGNPEVQDILFKVAQEEESHAAYVVSIAESLRVYYEPSDWYEIISPVLEKDLAVHLKRTGAEEWPERASQTLAYIQ
ncbi:MAG: hypothetical protein NZ958_04560 [Bacteroidia bacterium]|nr:hypothetical protein [Bacteroidia bacterium]MDW8089478.1 hypothetical protein [Bacteroidia bacterium]